jgi:hypothetical protein
MDAGDAGAMTAARIRAGSALRWTFLECGLDLSRLNRWAAS